MVRVKRRELEIVSQYVDKNNPKFELNYLYVDFHNLVATDTRVLCSINHGNRFFGEEKDYVGFFISKDIIELALKNKKAHFYMLKENSITLEDEHESEIFTISIERKVDGKFPDYTRIIPKEYKTKIKFHDVSHINGLFASQKVMIDPKRLPKKLQGEYDEFFDGFVCINERNLPVGIESRDGAEKIIMMPIVDSSLFDN